MATAHTRYSYTWQEADEALRAKILERQHDINVHYDWWDVAYEDAKRMAEMFGLDLRQKPVKLMNGNTRYDPSIYFSGFSFQGDGASFEGSYQYKPGGLKAVMTEAPQDTDLHGIVKALQDVQRKYFYQLRASITQSGRYCHEKTMSTDVEDARTGWEPDDKNDVEIVVKAMRDFARWIFKNLRNEYEYLTSKEAVIETLEANEYEFFEDGSIA